MGKGAFGAAVLYRKKDDGLMVVIKVSFLVIKVSCWWWRYLDGDKGIFFGNQGFLLVKIIIAGDKFTYLIEALAVIKNMKKEGDWENHVVTYDCPQEINMLDLSAVERQMALNEVWPPTIFYPKIILHVNVILFAAVKGPMTW